MTLKKKKKILLIIAAQSRLTEVFDQEFAGIEFVDSAASEDPQIEVEEINEANLTGAQVACVNELARKFS